MAALPRFVPLQEAARRMRVSVKETRAMIESGKIQGGVLPDGEMVVSESTIPTQKLPQKKDLPEYKKHQELSGVGIGINQAAKEYRIPKTTLYHWFQKGYIKSLGRDGQKVLLNKQDVAYCADVYRKSGSQGRRVFNLDGTPYRGTI